jgi:hypothetical protein
MILDSVMEILNLKKKIKRRLKETRKSNKLRMKKKRRTAQSLS